MYFSATFLLYFLKIHAQEQLSTCKYTLVMSVLDRLTLSEISQGSDPVPVKADQNGDIPSTSMIRSHSATGNLHGIQLNPVAADILRKEPEHETFSRINITAVGMLFRLISVCSIILVQC